MRQSRLSPEQLKRYLRSAGATLVGVGDVSDALAPDIHHLNRGISIAVRNGLNRNTVRYLIRLQKMTEEWLRMNGYRFLSIPPDSDRRTEKFISKLYVLFSHKTAATCSGLGWIGKNGLVINSQYGPRLSLATVLTDAPFKPDRPIKESLCGSCTLCVTHCPSEALTGHLWSTEEPYRQIVNYDKCSSLKNGRRLFEDKPNCGLCINICPYSRNGFKSQEFSDCVTYA